MSRVWAWVVVAGVVAVVVGGSSEAQDTAGDSARQRRAPSGFLGMRGKKDAPVPLEEATHDLQDDDLYPSLYDTSSLGLGMPLRGKKAPSGFLGMRGKKGDEEVFGHSLDDSELDMLLKRAPSGFLGMRGKKAPSGFLGMRGKKASARQLFPAQEYLADPRLFYAAQDDLDYYLPVWRAMTQQQQQKRTPSGFLGMRGKKALYGDDLDQDDLSLEKRAPSGFLGMRG